MPSGPMNLSAFHSTGLWLAVTATPTLGPTPPPSPVPRLLAYPGSERSRPARPDVRRQVRPDNATHAGDADHQGRRGGGRVGHGGNVGTGEGRVNRTRVSPAEPAPVKRGGGAVGPGERRRGGPPGRGTRRGRPPRLAGRTACRSGPPAPAAPAVPTTRGDRGAGSSSHRTSRRP